MHLYNVSTQIDSFRCMDRYLYNEKPIVLCVCVGPRAHIHAYTATRFSFFFEQIYSTNVATSE